MTEQKFKHMDEWWDDERVNADIKMIDLPALSEDQLLYLLDLIDEIGLTQAQWEHNVSALSGRVSDEKERRGL